MPDHERRPHPMPTRPMVASVGLVMLLLVPGVASAQEPSICTPALVVHTPTGSDGDLTAVAITAQAIDADVQDAWVNVAWEVATGVELTALSVVGTDGGVRTQADPPATGAATDVAALVFCGTADPALLPPGDDDADEEPAPEPVDDPEPDPATPDDAAAPDADEPEPAPPASDADGAAPGSGSGTSGSDTGTTSPSPAPPSAPTEQDSAAAEAPEEPDADPQAGNDPAEGDGPDPADTQADDATSEDADPEQATDEADAGTDDVADAEVEVLGVQLTQDDESGGPAWGLVLLVLGLGLLAVGAGVSVWRHWPAR